MGCTTLQSSLNPSVSKRELNNTSVYFDAYFAYCIKLAKLSLNKQEGKPYEPLYQKYGLQPLRYLTDRAICATQKPLRFKRFGGDGQVSGRVLPLLLDDAGKGLKHANVPVDQRPKR